MTFSKDRLKIKKVKTLILLLFFLIIPITFNSMILNNCYSKEIEEKNNDPPNVPKLNAPSNTHYFTFYKTITIDHNQVVGSGSYTNFPFLISIFDRDLRYDVQPDGDDIAFSIGNNWLDHEIEVFDQSFNSTHAQLIVWVRIPTLSTSTDTLIRMYYSNSTMSSRQNPEGVWESDYQAVYHLHDDFYDSTSHNRDGINSGSVDISGRIGDGQDFERSDNSDNINIGTWSVSGTEITIQTWVRFESFSITDARILSKNSGISDSSEDHVWMLGTWETPPDRLRGRIKTGTSDTSGTSTVIANSGDLSTNTWYLTTLRYDGSNIQFVLDGNQVDSFSKTGSLRVNNWPITIGNSPTGARAIDAIIDEVRISSTVRSNNWLRNEYLNQRDPNSYYSVGTKTLVNSELPNVNLFTYYKVITLDHTKITGTGSHVNFPVLLSFIDGDLKYHCQPDGDDIAFSINNQWLDHQIELFNQTYSSTQAQVNVWVRIPYLSATHDTNITMYYGNSTMSSRENPNGVWYPNYVGVWHLNDSPTGSVEDSTSYSNDGVTLGVMGVSNLVNCKIGKGFKLDGVNDMIRMSDSPSLDSVSDEGTLSIWLNWVDSSDGGYQRVMTSSNRFIVNPTPPPTYFGDGFEWAVQPDGDHFFYPNGGDGSNYNLATNPFTNNIWHYVVVTLKFSTKSVKIYLDGTSLTFSIENVPSLWNSLADPADWLWGGNNIIHDSQFAGKFDEIRVADIEHSGDWIMTEYENQDNPSDICTVREEHLIRSTPPNAEYFNFFKTITIDHTKVDGTGSHVNFPLLILLLDEDLRYDVQDDGDDIAFSNDGKWLDHQIEYFNQAYSATQASLIVWVRIPFLSTAFNTTIKMYYGNYTLNSQQNPRGVWGGYNSVWHLNESSGIGNYIKDSTSNNYHGTPFGTEFLSSGQIGGARNFLGVGDNRIIIDKGSEFFDGDNIFTFSFWIYPNYQSDAEWESMTDRTVFYKQSSVRLSRLWRQNWMSSGEGRYQADIQFSTYGTTYLNVLLYRQEWTYITYTYDGTYLSSYANGILGPSANIGGFSLIPDSSSFYLGSFNSFKGFLDEFRTSNTAKSQGWIVTEYNNQYNPNAFYLVGDEQSIKPVAYHDAQINAVDLYGNWLPEVTISMYQSTQLKDSDITNSDGSVIFTNIAEGEYNFTATISSNVAAITEIVNSTSSGILINKGFQIINLICNVGTNFFEITDADGAPVESGWVLVGNSSRILRECPIDNSGHTRFWWVNTLPYQYNYSVYYQNNFCNPSTIEVTSGNINTPNTTILKQVPLTTVEFTIITISSPIAPVSGAKLKFRLGDPYGISIANITTDLDGKATLRWLTSTALGGDYSLQIEFFGVNRFFNETLAGPPNVNNVSFTINNAASLEFRISINLLEFQTELVSLNPTDYILAEWGTEVNLRLLFNVTRVESGYENLLGPAYADSIAYQLLLGTTLVRSSSFQKEEIIGRYSVIIDTKTIENEGNYIIKVSGIKSGFTIPSDLIIQLNLLENEVELNQSENDDSAASVFWAENVNMTLNSYGKISESFTVKNAIFQNIDHEFNFLIPDIENQWNLSQIVFNFYNISWNVDISKINITIADPYGSFSYMFHNSNHSGWNYAQGTWLGITLDLNIVSPSFNNKFEFIIGGSFDGTVDISADALFIRDSVNLQYSKYNVSNVISILTESEGWAIKNITFEISNCYNSLTWNKVDLTDTESINITTNEGFKYSLDQGFTDGTGILTIDDFIIYPIGNQFLFTVESDPNVIFNVIIKVEYIQEFYRNLHLEFLNVTKAVSDVNNGGLVQVAATEKTKWADNAATLWVKSIQYNSTYYLPSELAMTITIGGQTFSVLDYVIGTGFISLSGFTRDQILTASIDTLSTVNFNLVLEIAYSKDVFYETLGTLTYEVIGAPTIFGIVSYDSDLGYYLQNIDTTLMDADEYTVRFTFTKGHYTSTMKEFKLIVNERITSINGDLEFYRHLENIYIEEAVNFTFLYTDVLTGERITNLRTQSYIWENYDSDGNVLSSGEGDIISTPSAQYILDFDTETRALGDYMLIITLDKDNYEYKNAMILLTINKRFLHYNLSDRFKNFRANVEQGKNIDITISLTDPTRGGIPLLNATVTLTISGTVYYFEHVANGTYMYSFSTSDINAFFTSQTLRGVINVSKINYISQQFSIIIIVEMPTFLGIPLFYLILIVSSIAVAAAALAGYRIYKNAKVPTYVKKVRSMKKAIKSKKDISESLLYRSKEVFVGENVNYKWEKIGLSLEDILNIKLKKKVLKAEKKISESVTRRELKPLGMVFMRWDERIGAEILNKYPEEVVISEKTLMQIYSTHEYSGEQGVITLSAGALNIISYYTGPETSYYLLLILDMTDDPDLYEGAMADVLRVLLENIENDVYLQLIPSLFQRLSLYPSLSEEEILALQYKDEIKQMIIDNLRDNAIISKSELTIWLREKYIEGFVDIEATLRELIKRDVIKQVSVKGLPSELIVLINDIYMLRVPPVEIFKSPIDRGLPAQFAKEYKEVVKNFFQEYHPSKEDNLKVIGILINPEVYETFRLLRTSIATRQDLEKLRTKGVKDIYGVLKLLWDNNLVKVFRDENNNEYYTLLSDFYMDLIFPKYLLQVIKKAYDQKSIANKALIEFLDVLEDTYYELKTKK